MLLEQYITTSWQARQVIECAGILSVISIPLVLIVNSLVDILRKLLSKRRSHDWDDVA